MNIYVQLERNLILILSIGFQFRMPVSIIEEFNFIFSPLELQLSQERVTSLGDLLSFYLT